jgi:hypothetical protein
MLKYSNNSLVVREARKMLVMIRGQITDPGFDQDSRILKKLYGEDKDQGMPYGFRLFYEKLKTAARQIVELGDNSGGAMLREAMLLLVDAEIDRLRGLEEMLEAEERQRIGYKSSASMIPGQEASDRLLRRETHLSREIERILTQLERFQRMRKGQPLPPQVDLKIST